MKMHLIYVNRPSLEPGAHDLQLLVPGQAHAGHFLCVCFWRERRRVGYEGLRERGERVVGVDVGEVLPTEPINVGQLVLVGQAADVVDVSVAEDIGVVACPDAIVPGRSRRQFKSFSNLMLKSIDNNCVITCPALSCLCLELWRSWIARSLGGGQHVRIGNSDQDGWPREDKVNRRSWKDIRLWWAGRDGATQRFWGLAVLLLSLNWPLDGVASVHCTVLKIPIQKFEVYSMYILWGKCGWKLCQHIFNLSRGKKRFMYKVHKT